MDLSNALIVFDWNGTLLSDTNAAWMAGNECLKFYGTRPLTLKEYRDHFTFPIIHFYHKCGLSTDDVLTKQDIANPISQQAYDNYARHARTRQGARELLDWLTAQNATCIILSNAQTDNIKPHLKRLKLEHYFTDICGHECDGTTILHKTTKHERLETYMRDHNHAPQNTIIIGDSAEEPTLGRALGLTSIGITDGCISRARLAAARPDHTISTLNEIIPLLK